MSVGPIKVREWRNVLGVENGKFVVTSYVGDGHYSTATGLVGITEEKARKILDAPTEGYPAILSQFDCKCREHSDRVVVVIHDEDGFVGVFTCVEKAEAFISQVTRFDPSDKHKYSVQTEYLDRPRGFPKF